MIVLAKLSKSLFASMTLTLPSFMRSSDEVSQMFQCGCIPNSSGNKLRKVIKISKSDVRLPRNCKFPSEVFLYPPPPNWFFTCGENLVPMSVKKRKEVNLCLLVCLFVSLFVRPSGRPILASNLRPSVRPSVRPSGPSVCSVRLSIGRSVGRSVVCSFVRSIVRSFEHSFDHRPFVRSFMIKANSLADKSP